MNDKNFDYGDFIIEYRMVKDGYLFFHKKKIVDLDEALIEVNKLKDNGFHDVILKKNKESK